MTTASSHSVTGHATVETWTYSLLLATEEHVLFFFCVSMHAYSWVRVMCVSENAFFVSDSEQDIYCKGPVEQWVYLHPLQWHGYCWFSAVTWFLCKVEIKKKKKIYLRVSGRNLTFCLNKTRFKKLDFTRVHVKGSGQGMDHCESSPVGWGTRSLLLLCILVSKINKSKILSFHSCTVHSL